MIGNAIPNSCLTGRKFNFGNWVPLYRPVIRDNARKYLKQFDKRTIDLIESVARDYMIKLGYPLDTAADWQEPPFFKLRSFLMRKLARSRSKRQHPKTYRLLASRQQLINSIVAECKARWRMRSVEQ